jgi:ribonuclease G
MQGDRAKHNILAPSKFGVVEITRQRVRPETDIKTSDKCPTCNGSGEVQATILYAEEIESKLKYLLTERNRSKLTLVLHPYMAAYFTKGLMSRQVKWFLEYKKWIKIKEDTSKGMVDYSFINEKGSNIKH